MTELDLLAELVDDLARELSTTLAKATEESRPLRHSERAATIMRYPHTAKATEESREEHGYLYHNIWQLSLYILASVATL